METYFGHEGFRSYRPVVTMGMFDGVHRGHRALLDSLVSKADSLGVESLVITLDPHPRIVLSGGDSSLRFLTSLDEKGGLMEEAGIDKLLVIPFSMELSRMQACDFIRKYMVDIIGVQYLILGFDHHFGYRGQGNALTIADCAARYDFGVVRMEALKDKDMLISSTSIREMITAGELEQANKLLGYSYILKGKVVEGRKIGRLLGYPTANIAPDYPYKLIPADGVYAVEVTLDGIDHKAMLYIGPRPTIERYTGMRTIEVNIFNFNDDIYGKDISVCFRHRLRGDRKFSNKEELLDQISKDKDEAIRLLAL
ncbi:MAG: riboflavin biosynthesis protein RibF [Bacteroidales bacterium]|nr:riboflavin biosynthesis protein RibF [Bacteroidales bacterium]